MVIITDRECPFNLMFYCVSFNVQFTHKHFSYELKMQLHSLSFLNDPDKEILATNNIT